MTTSTLHRTWMLPCRFSTIVLGEIRVDDTRCACGTSVDVQAALPKRLSCLGACCIKALVRSAIFQDKQLMNLVWAKEGSRRGADDVGATIPKLTQMNHARPTPSSLNIDRDPSPFCGTHIRKNVTGLAKKRQKRL